MQQYSLRRLILSGFITVVLMLTGFSVQAAEDTGTEAGSGAVYEEEAVVVTATRTKQQESQAPVKTEVVTREEIEASGATTVAEVLSAEGVIIPNYGGKFGAATVHLDGATAKQTLILVNGIPANTGCGGEVDLSYFPTAGVSRIEIAHGPLSSLYGANALGGAINIITDLTSDAPINQLTLAGGNNSYEKMGLTFQQKKFGIASGGMVYDGYRTYSEAKDRFLMGQYDFIQNSQDSLTMNFIYRAKNNQVPGSLDWLMRDDQFEETTSVDIVGKHSMGDLIIEYKVFGQYLNLEYNNNDPATYSYSDQFYRHQAKNFGTDLAGIYTSGGHKILGGLMVKQEDFDSTASGKHDCDNGAVFVQDDWRLHEKWQLVSGLRWDTGSVYSSPVCPKVNLNYLFNDNIVFKIGYGKAFRAPTTNELYWSDYGNPDLKPETGERYDFTGEWRQNNQAVTFNVFNSVIDNEISGITQAENNKTRTNGANLYWQNHWNNFFTTGIKYIWQSKKAWDKSARSYSVDKDLFGVNTYVLESSYNYQAWRATLAWQFVNDRNYFDSSEGQISMPDYNIINLNIKYQFNPRLNYGLTVNNLTDKDYQVIKGYPMPGREYYLSANYTF